MLARRDNRMISGAELPRYVEANKVVAQAWVAHRGSARPIRIVNAYAAAAAYLRSRGPRALPVVGIDQVADARVAASPADELSGSAPPEAAGATEEFAAHSTKEGAVLPRGELRHRGPNAETESPDPPGIQAEVGIAARLVLDGQ